MQWRHVLRERLKHAAPGPVHTERSTFLGPMGNIGVLDRYSELLQMYRTAI
jgi:hypothetical protein